MRSAVFLDRDGVINRLLPNGAAPRAPWRLSEFELLPGVTEAVDLIKSQGFQVHVVTNQPGVVDCDMTKEELDEINEYLREHLGVDSVFCALDKSSAYYKPRNAAFEMLVDLHGIDRKSSYMVGDRWKDVVPAKISGLTAILVGTCYECPEEYAQFRPDYIVRSLTEAASIIVNTKGV